MKIDISGRDFLGLLYTKSIVVNEKIIAYFVGKKKIYNTLNNSFSYELEFNITKEIPHREDSRDYIYIELTDKEKEMIELFAEREYLDVDEKFLSKFKFNIIDPYKNKNKSEYETDKYISFINNNDGTYTIDIVDN